MAVFEEARLPAFEDYMVEYLKEFTPLHADTLGVAGLRLLVRFGMERAKKYGFTRRGPARFYIESIALLGVDFDTDPQYTWAFRHLCDPSVPDQTRRADRVYYALTEFLDAVGGPDRNYAIRALHKMTAIPFKPIPVASPDFAGAMIRLMQEWHPEKVDFVGQAALRNLVLRAIEEARRLQVATDAGICLLVGLMFIVGHGCVNDPSYPWIAGTLTNPAITDSDQRIRRLYSKTMTYLDHVLLQFDGK